MIGEKIQDEFNEQIKHEIGSAYIYMAMQAYFHNEGWIGFAHWMQKQANEELEHAKKFFQHIVERNGRVELFAIEKPQKEWGSPLEAFKAALEHEKFITGRINYLMTVAREENDNPAQVFLNWFVEEQVEEEANAEQIVLNLERIKDSVPGLFMLDAHLGKRE